MRRIVSQLVTFIAAASLLAGADFTLTEKTEFTGGALAGALKMAAKFSKQVDTVTTTTQHFSGDRMASVGTHSRQIIDLGAETFTDINPDKKEYSVISFAEWQQAMENMMAKMSGQKKSSGSGTNEPEAEVKFSFDADRTGKQKQIAGAQAEQVVYVMKMTATDKKSGQQGNFDMVVDAWMGEVPGHEVVDSFYKRMAEKLGGRALASMKSNPFMMQQGMGTGMAEMQKKMAEMKGIPLLQISRFVTAGQTDPVIAAAKGDSAGQPLPQPKSEGPSVKEAAAEAAVGSVIGGLGGFGGFGRKKKKEAPKPEPEPAANSAAMQGVMMEMVTETVTASSAPVDPSVFQVPAGYKQVEHEMKKMLK